MDGINIDVLHGHDSRPVGRVHRHHAFHGAALVASVADHARDAACHIVDGMGHHFRGAVPQKHQAAGHSGAGGDGTAAEGRQLARVFFDIHADQIAQRGGPQKLLLRIAPHLIGRVEGHGGNDAVGPRPGDAHGWFRKPQHPGLNGRIAEQGGSLLLIIRNDAAAVLCQQIAGISGFRAGKPRLAERKIHLKSLPYKSNLLRRHRQGVGVQLLQCIAVNQRRRICFSARRFIGPARLFIDRAAVLRDADNIGVGIPNLNSRFPLLGLYLGPDKNPAGYFRHFHLNLPCLHHGLSPKRLLRRNAVQTLQSLIRIRAHCPQGGGVGIAHLIASGDAAGKSIFEHAAVKPQLNPAYFSLRMLSGYSRRKGDRSRLGNPQSRLHILPDQFCQFVHSALSSLHCRYSPFYGQSPASIRLPGV